MVLNVAYFHEIIDGIYASTPKILTELSINVIIIPRYYGPVAIASVEVHVTKNRNG